MANRTPNLSLILDAGGKVGLDQMVADNFKIIGAALGINIPVRTEGMSALKHSAVSGMAMIGAALGKTLVVDTAGVVGFEQSLLQNWTLIDGLVGGTPSLANLALSGTLTVGTAALDVIIVGTTAGSTVALGGAGAAGLTVSGSGTTRTINGTPTTRGALTVTETLAGATGSPKSGALTTVGAAATYLIQNGATNTTAKAKLAAVKAGTDFFRVAHVGSSIVHGFQAEAGSSTRTGTAANSYPAQLAALTQARLGAPSIYNANFGPSDDTGSYTVTKFEPRLSGSNVNPVASGGLLNAMGGVAWQAGTSLAAVLGFQPNGLNDTCEFYYYTDVNTSLGSTDLSVNGGDVLANVSGNQAQATRKVVLTFGSRSNAPIIRATNNQTKTMFLAGFDCYDSTVKTIRHFNLGWGGATSAALSTDTLLYNYLPSLKALSPDLTIIETGSINDAKLGTPTPIATFKANVQKAIDAAKLSGDAWLATANPVHISVTSQASQDAYAQAVRDLAEANGLYLLDWYAMFGTYANMVANGYSADFYKIHPNTAGYAAMANVVTTAMETLA